MRPELWPEVESALGAALKRPEAERLAWVGQFCKDAEVRAQVETLLAVYNRAEGFLAPAWRLIGAHLGPYEILELIGAGGMGEVYRARDPRIGREVAIKILPPAFSADPDRLRRFAQEVRAAGGLNHPNIIVIHDIGTHKGIPYLVSELLEGETLRSRLNRGALPLDKVLEYALAIANGLGAAHSKGIVHRDLKPENLFLTESGQVKILDFGLARLTHAPHTIEQDSPTVTNAIETAPGTLMGTAAYMSPEQVRGQPCDHRSDLFSLGVILYEAATGRRPFDGPTFLSIANQITTVDPPLPSSLLSNLPSAFDKIVARALAKDGQRDRYASASVLADDLRSMLSAPTPGSSVRPETKYAVSGGVSIAYQVVGNGPLDLVYIMGWVSNLDSFWDEPSYARFLRRLASFSRLILFDKRGTGLSDRVSVSELPTLEQRMDDVRAVMDAAGSARAVVFGVSEGGPMAALFGATYPDRTLGLIMYGSYATRVWDPEYPWAPTPTERQKFFDALRDGWGGVVDLTTMAPTAAHDPAFCEWWAAYLRQSASPGAALALAKMNSQIDIRHILPAIRVPTLVVHRTGDLDVQAGGSRFMAQHIPGAKHVELPGDDHLPWVGDQDAILGEVEEFVQGIRQIPDMNRVLATILFVNTIYAPSDAVGRYQTLVSPEIRRFRGREVEVTARRLVVTFDGPGRAIRAAYGIRGGAGSLGIELGFGLHTGECELSSGAVRGAAREIAAGIAGCARSGEILVSSTVRDLVAGSGFRFEEHGVRSFPGAEGEWRLLLVTS